MTLRLSALIGGLVIIFCSAADICATPVYFQDQTYSTLDQLDQALEEGEISYDEYLLLLERFVGEPYEDVEIESFEAVDAADTAATAAKKRSQNGLSYRCSFKQRLGEDDRYTRYDRLTGRWKYLGFKVSLEQAGSGVLLTRSRSLSLNSAAGELVIGSYDLRVGEGVTLGNGSYHSALYEDADFSRSLVMPIKNRHNGLLARRQFGAVAAGLLYSRLEGNEFRRDVGGAYVQVGKSKKHAGLVVLQQRLGHIGQAAGSTTFLAPYFRAGSKTLEFSGESSLGVGSASAHVYQAKIRGIGMSQELTLFSYSRSYRNLQSGGYAYSDYDDLTIADSDFEYRDKRAGRYGMATTAKVEMTRDVDLGASLVRWNNRLDNRRCAAGKTTLTIKDLTSFWEMLTVRAIWENLDLTMGDSYRYSFSLSVKAPSRQKFQWDGLIKLDKRIRSDVLTEPLTLRADLLWQAAADFATTLTVKYYNPNVTAAAKDYLLWAIGQKVIRAKDFSLWLKAQNRYFLDRNHLDIWEARVYFSFAA